MKRFFLIILCFFITGMAFSQELGYQLINIDGIKVNIGDIRFEEGEYGASVTSGGLSINREVDLTGNINDIFSEEFTINFEEGYSELIFNMVAIKFYDGIGIKGYAEVDEETNTFMYTTANGPVRAVLNSDDWDPNDAQVIGYDYTVLDYIYDKSDGGINWETTMLPELVTIGSEDPLEISLLIDIFQVAFYWNGDDTKRVGAVFYQAEDFPAGTPVVGVAYIPTYVAVNRDLISETYAITSSENVSALTPTAAGFYDQTKVMTLTLVFDSDTGEFFAGRSGNSAGANANWNLEQFVTTGSVSGGAYTFEVSNLQKEALFEGTLSNFVRTNIDAQGTSAYTNDSGTFTLNYVRVK